MKPASTPLLYLFGPLFAIIVIMAISETTGKKEPVQPELVQIYKPLPDNCLAVYRYRIGRHNFYDEICYEKGMIIDPPIPPDADSSYIARIEAAKDSLRRVYE